MNRNRAVFLGQDGMLIHDTSYTCKVEDFRLLDHGVEGLRLISVPDYIARDLLEAARIIQRAEAHRAGQAKESAR